MRKFVTPKEWFIFLGLLFLGLLMACNTATKQSPVTGEDSGKAIVTQGARNTDPCLSPLLNCLCIPAVEFAVSGLKDKQLVFRYFIKDNSVTLHGWRYKNLKFEPDIPDPVIKLETLAPSDVSLKDGYYLTSLVLYKDDLKLVRKKIKDSSYLSLLFIPKDTVILNGDGYVWKIYGSKKSCSENKKIDFLFAATEITQFNPSPPREFSR